MLTVLVPGVLQGCGYRWQVATREIRTWLYDRAQETDTYACT